MKVIFSLFLILLCKISVAGAIITGKLSDLPNVRQIEAYLPIGPFTNLYSPEIIQVNNERFVIHVPLTRPAFVRLRVGRDPVYIIVQPGDNISFELFNTKDRYKFIRFRGKNAAGMNWLNVYNYQPMENYQNHDRLIETGGAQPTEFIPTVKKFLIRETQPLDSLKALKLINEPFYGLAKTEINDLHLLNLYKTAWSLEHQKPDQRKMYAALTVGIIGLADLNLEIHTRTCFGGMFLDAYYENQSAGVSRQTGSGYHLGPYQGYTLSKNMIRCRQIGNLLLFQQVNHSKEFDYDKALSSYLSEFPGSPYRPVLTNVHRPAVGTANRIIRSNSKVRIDTTGVYDSLNDVLAQFKGKKVLVDLWASWCIPCRAEFGHYQKLKPIFAEKDIVPVYISIDVPGSRRKWKELVETLQLEGLHILANSKLVGEIKSDIYKSTQLSIPRYLLFDENGDLINGDAPRPSDPALISLLSR